MLVYFVTFLLCMFVQLFYKESSELSTKRIIWTLLPIFLFGALRTSIGDGTSYLDDYIDIQEASDVFNVNEHLESGYVLLNKLMPSFKSLELFIVILLCISLGTIFKQYLDGRCFILAILMLFLCGDGILFFVLGTYRNGIGACIFLLSLWLLYKQKYIYYLVMLLLASTFHTSMLFSMLVPLLVTFSMKLNTRSQTYIWIGLFIFFILADQMGLIAQIEPIVSQYFFRYDPVIDTLKEGRQNLGSLNIVGSGLLLFGLMYFANNEKSDSKAQFIYRLGMLYPFASIMGALNARMTQVYAPMFVLAVALLSVRPSRFKRLYIWFAILYSSYNFYLWINSAWSSKHWIYHSIFGDIG